MPATLTIPVGTKFGDWTVLGFAGRYRGMQLWNLACDFGHLKTTRARHLKIAKRPTCKQCKGLSRPKLSPKPVSRHGMSKRPEYYIWNSMRQRCANPNHASFKYYGGRGISVCERWSKFSAFFEDMGCRPSSKYSIERQNNDGNYEPGNCVWATAAEQAANRRGGVWQGALTYQGETRSCREWARIKGINRGTLSTRLRRGMSFADALEIPVSVHNRSHNFWHNHGL